MKKIIFTSLLISLFFLTSCVTLRHPQFSPEEEASLYPESTYIPEHFNWSEVCPGISSFDYKNPAFPIIYHAVKIDLTQPGLELLAFPDSSVAEAAGHGKSNGADSSKPIIFRGIPTSKFAEQNKCDVAVNLSPFSGKNGSWNLSAKLGSTRQLVGLHVADGFIFSEPVNRYAAISFTKKMDVNGKSYWQAYIERNQSQKTAYNSDFAFGGFYTVLEEELVQEFKARTHDSRSGAGLSKDGKTLYLLVVEGENSMRSQGLSYPQCAMIFKAMGCYSALEFDGGGSSELCIKGKSVLTYKNFRTQANSLGFIVKKQE